MYSDYENNRPAFGGDRDPLFSRTIKAGKRLYYLDVKRDRRGEYYVAMTESRRVQDGTETERPVFEKHKVFVYREDLLNFLAAFTEAAKFIGESRPLTAYERRPHGERRPYGGEERAGAPAENGYSSEERAFGVEEYAYAAEPEESVAPAVSVDPVQYTEAAEATEPVEPEVPAENGKKSFFGGFGLKF